MAGRTSRLEEVEYAKLVAELYVAGTSMDDMTDELACSKSQLRVWIKDPRVQAHARRIAVERAQRISRRIDGEIEARLAHIDDWDLQDILKVRKEFLDRPLKIGAGEETDMGKVTNELSEAMDQKPDFAAALMALIEKGDLTLAPAE